MNFLTTKVKILFSLILFPANFGLADLSLAATINAASCSYADVAAAVGAASGGDTVIVPSGSCSWTGTLIITQGITLSGAGVGNTIIVNNIASHAPLIVYTPSNYDLDTPFRITGFTFDLNNNGHALNLGEQNRAAPFTMQTRVRIDHNRFVHAATLSYQAITNKCTMNGVVDSNTFDGVWYPIRNDPGCARYLFMGPKWGLNWVTLFG